MFIYSDRNLVIIEMPGTDDSRSGKSIGVCEAILAVVVELLYIVSIVETGQGLSLYTLKVYVCPLEENICNYGCREHYQVSQDCKSSVIDENGDNEWQRKEFILDFITLTWPHCRLTGTVTGMLLRSRMRPFRQLDTAQPHPQDHVIREGFLSHIYRIAHDRDCT
jgi:hypothetical protein